MSQAAPPYVLLVLRLELGPCGRHLGHPRLVSHPRHGVGQRLERGPLVADDPEFDRQVPADVLGGRVNPDIFRIRPEGELAQRRHAILTHQQHQIRAGQRAGRRIGGQLVVCRKLPLGRARLDDRNLGALGQTTQRIPAATVEDAVARDDNRTLGRPQQLNRLVDRARVRVWLRVGPIFRLVVEVLNLARVLEPGARDLGREVQMDWLWHAAPQLSERVAGVLVDARRGDEPFPVLAYPLGCRLLISVLDAPLGVFGEDRLVAGQHQDG